VNYGLPYQIIRSYNYHAKAYNPLMLTCFLTFTIEKMKGIAIQVVLIIGNGFLPLG